MNRFVFAAAFAVGLAAVVWVGVGFVGTSALALAMTAAIAAVYLLGALELRRFRAATALLDGALAGLAQPPSALDDWLGQVPPALRHPVRLRVEGERVALPGPALTPYLVGLLVMLGMLGTFLGMVVTFKGAVFALEGSSDLQAIRSALAAPIKGLGLSFGTSVAGVAASAMLGLMSALARRERMEAARQLDARVAGVLRPFSLAHQRQEAYKALQTQAQALPDVVGRLGGLMDALERRSEELDAQLLDRQQRFHQEASAAYGGLAEAVGRALHDSLAAAARASGDSLRPVVETAMTAIAQESQRTHQRLADEVQVQLDGLTTRFEATARTVSEAWSGALQAQARTSEALVGGLDRTLQGFASTFEQQAGTLLGTVDEALARSHAAHEAADRQRLDAWTRSLETMAGTLADEWQHATAQGLARQQAVCAELERAAGQITERAGQQASRTLEGMAGLLTQAEALVSSRVEAEAQWMAQQGERMDRLAGLWRAELGALRDEEAARGQAAVERLDALQAAVAGHLATLGAALEAPLSRLLQTAAEVPQAAAEVIAQLRQEMSRLAERDQATLQERAEMMREVQALLQAVGRVSGEQQAAVASLVTSATSVLEQAGRRFSNALDEQAGRTQEAAAHVAASAVELSSLGASFGHGVQLYAATSEKLLDSLQRIDGALQQSLVRSDEQLAYYVAQAREVIDLSIASQQGIVEDLRRLRGAPAVVAEGAAR